MSAQSKPLTSIQYTLPDLFAICKLANGTNPHAEKAGLDSWSWYDSCGLFPEEKKVFLKGAKFETLASYVYPSASYEQLRICCDFVHLLFVNDEFSDDLDHKGVQSIETIISKSFKDLAYDDNSSFARVAKDFRDRYTRLAGPNSARRFFKYFERYLDSVSAEAHHRVTGKVLDVQGYTELRRENSAVSPALELNEMILGIDLPDEVFEDPMFAQAFWAAVDLVWWANDLYSYNVEQAKGHSGNNVITVLMNYEGMDLQSACDYVGVHSQTLMERYHTGKASVRSFGPEIDNQIKLFLDAAGYWIRGNIDWSFDSQRYFGLHHLQVKVTRSVTLRPLSRPEDYLRQELEERKVLAEGDEA